MDRQAIIGKIASLLRLQESSDFDGESAAAAAMIDKLCAKYGVTVNEATTPQVLTEDFHSTGRLNEAEFILFCAAAKFYDAKGYLQVDNTSRRVSTFKCIGTESQQIQTKLYYDFLLETMKKECEKALKGEQILAELTGGSFDKTGFRSNFYKAFSFKVKERLYELKADRDPHEHKEITSKEVSKMRFGIRKVSGAAGIGAQIGANAGENASLHRQTSGRQTLALSGR